MSVSNWRFEAAAVDCGSLVGEEDVLLNTVDWFVLWMAVLGSTEMKLDKFKDMVANTSIFNLPFTVFQLKNIGLQQL
jgi:hypothetical protein